MTAALTVREQPGTLTAAEAHAWTQAQIQYENLAGDRDIAARALKIAKEIVTEWDTKVQPLHRRWRATHFMLTGNTLDRSSPEDIHVPELYKMIETIVPRIEEQLRKKEPWFRCVGRKPIDKRDALSIAAFLDWQLDQTKFQLLFQPLVRDMLVCQVAAIKTLWDRREVRRFKKNWTKIVGPDGEVAYKQNGKWVDEIDYDGPVDKLVDPFDFIMDPKATDPQLAAYVGDRCWMTWPEIERYGSMFGWENLNEVRDAVQQNSLTDTRSDFYRWSRDPTAKYGGPPNYVNQGGGRPPVFEVVNLWLKAQVTEDGDYKEFEFVVINGQTMAVVRQNILEGQFRPYSIFRTAKNGHELYGIGPLDNAVRINQHLDRLHAIGLRSAEIAGCPMVFASEDSDMPDSLYKVRPFTVFKGVGDVKFSQVPDGMIRALPMFLQLLSMNIQETVGAYKIQMGQEVTGGTATEATLALQEGNRRTRGLILSVADGLDQLLHIHHRFNQMLVIGKTVFRAIGKRGIELQKEYVELGPDTLMADVDFEFVGLRDQSNYGLRSVGYQTLGNAYAPFILANADRVNQLRMLHGATEELIGPDEADALIRVPTDPSMLRSQEEEMLVLLAGVECEVSEEDDDEQHWKTLLPYWREALKGENGKFKGQPRVIEAILRHGFAHQYSMKRKEAQQAAAQQRQKMLELTQPAQAGGTPGVGAKAPQRGGLEQPGQTKGQNPGPADSRKTPKMGTEKRMNNQADQEVG